MSFQLNMPPSMVRQMAKEEEAAPDEESASKKREDWKKLKELEEARKAGTAPAMKDEEGKDINPHIPQYIMQAPWYFGSTAPTLRHQRPQDEKHQPVSVLGNWYKRGVTKGTVATKFRKGACENCGALTHKKKDCMERPRKVGAKFTGSEIAPDEFIQPQLSFDYDGKRDRWNGYDTEMHKKIVDEYAEIEEAKRELKSQRMDQGIEGIVEDKEEVADESEEEADEDKYADNVDMPGQKFETKQRITVRNLRIREDTAKYLYNLDVSSAYYDPKTRSMRENPYQGTPKEEAMYGGDNFVRWSGDAHNMAERQLFAWEAYEKGTEAHLQADPTRLEILAKEYQRKKEDYKTTQKDGILSKYGGEEHLEAPAKELLLAQSEDYVEYSRHGTVIKGQEKARAKSRYEEDVYLNNHTSIWGSYWKDGQWGFKCCHSLIKMSYCTGQSGKAVSKSENLALTSNETEGKDQPLLQLYYERQAKEREEELKAEQEVATKLKEGKEKEAKEKAKKKKARNKKKKEKKKKRRQKNKKKKRKHRKHSSSSSDSSSDSSDSSSSSESEDETAVREKKILEAMKREEARVKEINRIMTLDERKRPYNSMYDDVEPTEEEMEAFRRKRVRADDPMAQFL